MIPPVFGQRATPNAIDLAPYDVASNTVTPEKDETRAIVLEVPEAAVLYFRARRGHLAGSGASDARSAARAMIGAQAQQLYPALLALSQRTSDRPTFDALQAQLLESKELVRIWGQRDTLHVFDPGDWATVISAKTEWAPGGRRGGMPPEALVDQAMKIVEAQGTACRTDLLDLSPQSYLRVVKERLDSVSQLSSTGDAVKRFAAGRLLWRLTLRGDACSAGKIGSEQLYAARSSWFPDLPWPAQEPQAAATRLARRYLGLYGPATVMDVAHFFGARVREAKAWLDSLAADRELVEVECDGRERLIALAEDTDALAVEPPNGLRDWPVRLLPMWDAMLMSHADKSWAVPDAADRKLIWKKAAVVAPVVLARGKPVATWSHKATTKALRVAISPLSGWREKQHAGGVRREARAVAAHLGLEDAEVSIE